jgi:hypothetical protein
MKKSRLAESKIVTLRQDGQGISISNAANGYRRMKADDPIPSEILVEQLELENDRLQKIATNLSLANEMLRRSSMLLRRAHIKDVTS